MDLTVRVDPSSVTLAAGQEATVTVVVSNASDNVEHYGVRLSGLPEGCAVSTQPEVTKLHPGGSGEIQVRISADPLRPPLAGRGFVGVTAASPYRPQVTRTAELALEVLPAPGLLLSASPEVVSGGDRDVALELTNTGNTTLDVALGGHDSEGRVRLAFTPPLVRLPARATARADLRMRARRPLSGTDVRRQVTIVATSAAEEQQRVVSLVQRPWVPGGVTRLVAAGSGVAVLAAAVITAATLVVKNQVGPGPTPTPGPTTSTSGSPTSGGSTTTSPSSSPTSPSSSPTSPTSGGQTTSTGGGAPGQSLTVDLTKPPQGQATTDQRLSPAAYPGVVLSVVTDTVPSTCAAHEVVSFLQLQGGRTAVMTGDFGTDANGTPQGLCNDMPLRIELPSPARAVAVTFFALPAPGASPTDFTYAMVSRPDGTTQQRTIGTGESVTMTAQAAGSGGITSVELGGVPPNTGVAAALTSIVVTQLG